MKKTMQVMHAAAALLFLCTVQAFAQTVDYKAGVAKLPAAVEGTLKEMMTASGVKKVVISSGARTIDEQVDAMIGFIKANDVAAALKLYGPEGDAVVNVYSASKAASKSDADIKSDMVAELTKQMPSALANKRLMHVGRENEFVVFDVSIPKVEPADKVAALEATARTYVNDKKLHRFLGSGEGEANALHFEFDK